MRHTRILHSLSLCAILAAPSAYTQTRRPSAGSAPAASPSIASGQKSEPDAVPGPAKQEAENGSEAFRHSPSVIKLGGMMGMKPATASSAFEWLNFFILAGAVLYALVRTLPKAFRGRSENIQKNIVEARVATEEARARLTVVEARLGKLDGEIIALRIENDRAAAEEEQRIHAQVEEEKARMLQAAEQEIAAASAAAQRSLRAYAAEIAVDHATSQMRITPDDDHVLIESFVGKLGASGGQN